DVSVYRPSQSRFRDAGYLPGEYALLWISGTFQRPGKETLEFHNLPRCTVPDQKWADPLDLGLEYSYSGATELPAGRSSHRFVGAFHARQVVRGLNMLVATKEMEIGKKKPDDPSAEAVRTEIDRLRKEIVRLSKEFSFIDTETAFIALPEELRKKYGFLEQKYSPGEIYGLEDLAQGIVPEPSTWLTIGLGLLGAVFFARKKISRGRQRG
ncbi:MAG: PEP-CTERM sorting domain-containing protein, partial [Candidatus Aureabacteria bacterium]|nr:PEP-CTERM sorting domain-containing protein [Candidatus Auribacterota bacterium]